MNKFILSLSFLLFINSCTFAANTNQVFQTKFGELKFTRNNGTIGSQARKIFLGDKLLVDASERVDGYGFNQRLVPGNLIFESGVDSLTPKKSSGEKDEVNRLVVLEGEDGNCVRQLFILDFTGDTPYVSDRFGYNPEGKLCLKFKRAKWGKKTSYIYLDGPLTYLYKTRDGVISPIE